MYECDRWYEYNGEVEFENPPKYRKVSKDSGYYIIALYSFGAIQPPDVYFTGPFVDERNCDELMSVMINK